MGVSNQSFYKVTEHFVDRANERFGIEKSNVSALKFFRSHAGKLRYVAQNENYNGDTYEIWQDNEAVFILNPLTYHIVTTYTVESRFQEELPKESVIKDSAITNIERSIDNEIYNEYLDFVNNNEENISRAFQLMQVMRRTKRRDYRDKQIEELQELLSSVTKELEIKNVAKTRLEVVKQALVKK